MRRIERPQWWWTSFGEKRIYVRIYDYLRLYYLEAKYFFQRGWQGFSHKDFWNAKNYIAYIIVEACRYLRARKSGYPSRYKNMREWDRVLAKIQHGFSLYMKYQYDGQTKYKKELHMSFKLLEENFESLWD